MSFIPLAIRVISRLALPETYDVEVEDRPLSRVALDLDLAQDRAPEERHDEECEGERDVCRQENGGVEVMSRGAGRDRRCAAIYEKNSQNVEKVGGRDSLDARTRKLPQSPHPRSPTIVMTVATA